jgi:hypothetical protein
MRPLPRPNLNAAAVIDACINSIQDQAIRDGLAQIAGTLVLSEADYIMRGTDMALFSIPQSPTVGGVVSGTTMKRVYASTFVKSARTRAMYDALKAAPENDMCPLCAQRTVSTLDHYLAQSLHANLTIVPANLVPACAECNKNKLDRQPANAADQSFHPYFDNFDDARWLRAQVVQGSPAALLFNVSQPPLWDAMKFERAQRHFNAFKLAPLYASHAGVELTNIRFSLSNIAARGSPEDIQAFLLDRAASARHANLNSWQTATYEALAESAWFCEGGFAA